MDQDSSSPSAPLSAPHSIPQGGGVLMDQNDSSPSTPLSAPPLESNFPLRKDFTSPPALFSTLGNSQGSVLMDEDLTSASNSNNVAMDNLTPSNSTGNLSHLNIQDPAIATWFLTPSVTTSTTFTRNPPSSSRPLPLSPIPIALANVIGRVVAEHLAC